VKFEIGHKHTYPQKGDTMKYKVIINRLNTNEYVDYGTRDIIIKEKYFGSQPTIIAVYSGQKKIRRLHAWLNTLNYSKILLLERIK
jgi:hypothetical protein